MTEKKETRSEKIQVRFTPTQKKQLEKQASQEGRTASNLLHTIAMSYLNNN